MATDKRLDQVSTLTDFDYALIVKGTDVSKVTKQQLAELVGDLLYGATTKETLASVVAGQLRYNVLKKTVNLTEEAIAIAPVETYSSYLLSIKYSDQSSLFFVGFWNVIVVTKELANNLKNIEVNLGIGNNSIYIRSTSGTKQNLSYSLIQL